EGPHSAAAIRTDQGGAAALHRVPEDGPDVGPWSPPAQRPRDTARHSAKAAASAPGPLAPRAEWKAPNAPSSPPASQSPPFPDRALPRSATHSAIAGASPSTRDR